MSDRPYFTITREAFEKNAGYKSTVHALAELIDNSFEAEASKVAVILMVDRNGRLDKIAVVDNGKGMNPDLLQAAVCEKAGSYIERQHGTGPNSRRKLGKYGVGLPKASISQCNKFTVWSWTSGGPKKAHRNSIDITDEVWVKKGAWVPQSPADPAPADWLKIAELTKAKSGTLVLWEDLEGVTWARARWGEQSGLVPNLAFVIGRVYRNMISVGDLEVRTIVVDRHFKPIENEAIGANDPLYLTKGASVSRFELPDGRLWPPDDPMFDEVTSSEMKVVLPYNGQSKTVTVRWRNSAARRSTFARLERRSAGEMPHGQHARRNVGLSILREGREINLSQALARPSEPRERWFGVELDLPHELDSILGMTNNKQEYTRLELVLKDTKESYLEDDETTQKCLERIEKEDSRLALCLRIAWRTQEVWDQAKSLHLGMREEVVGKKKGKDTDSKPEPTTPEDEAEDTASNVDPKVKPADKREEKRLRKEIRDELIQHGVPATEADQIVARVMDRGLSYAIAQRGNIGSPFFAVTEIKGVKFLQLNTDHPMHEFLKTTLESADGLTYEEMVARLSDAKLAILLMLEGWGKIETEAVGVEKSRLIHHREDWGRVVGKFIEQLRKSREGEE